MTELVGREAGDPRAEREPDETAHTSRGEVSGEGRDSQSWFVRGWLLCEPRPAPVAHEPPPARAAGSWCRGRACAWGPGCRGVSQPGTLCHPHSHTPRPPPRGAQSSLLSAEEQLLSLEVGLALSACFQKVFCPLCLGRGRTQG